MFLTRERDFERGMLAQGQLHGATGHSAVKGIDVAF